MPRVSVRARFSRLGEWAGRGTFLAFCALLLAAFAMGGGARGDIASLMILRPLAILLLGYGLWTLRWEHVAGHRYLFGFAVAILVVTLVQLIPLPPSMWTRLPGREFVVEIDRTAGLGAVWRPISLVPGATWNAFFSLMVPLGVLVLGAQLTAEERLRMLPLVIGVGLLSGVLALLQVIGPPDGPLYFYKVTNQGSAVGLFANRNHQAVLLAVMFPMLALFASLADNSGGQALRRGLAIGAGMFLIPLILITGSRMGLVTGGLGLASVLLLYRPKVGTSGSGRRSRSSSRQRTARHQPQQKAWRNWGVIGFVAVLGLGLSLLTILLGRAEALQRFVEEDGAQDFRLKAWDLVIRMVGEYFPFGSGYGSFVEVYQIQEPRALLDSTYFNHAHNDWLEVLLTGGLPAFLLLGFACVLVFGRALKLARAGGRLRKGMLFSRLGLVLVVQFAIASFADYPLRTPALASLFVLATLWAAAPLKSWGEAVDAEGARKAEVF